MSRRRPLRGMKKANSSSKARNGVKRGKTTKLTPVAKKAGPAQVAKAKQSGAAAAVPSLQERIAEAKKLEALDRAKPVAAAPTKAAKARAMRPAPATDSAASPLRNSDFPNTYINQIAVQLDDPDHSVTLTW